MSEERTSVTSNGSQEVGGVENLRLEYQMAQDMLKHYDTLNWQIGSILIAGVVVFTGLVINKDSIELMHNNRQFGIVLMVGVPILSLSILLIWLLWFRRHRALYNLRNETLQRIEGKLGMFHYLRVAEADINAKGNKQDDLSRLRVIHEDVYSDWRPLYEIKSLEGMSGYNLAKLLCGILPFIQFLLLLTIFLTSGAGISAPASNNGIHSTPLHEASPAR